MAVAARPDDISWQQFLALTHERLAAAGSRLGQTKEAHKHLQTALQLRRELFQIETNNPSRQAAYLLALARAGQHAEATAGAAKLHPRVANSTQLLLQLARCWAVSGAADKGYVDQAIDALRSAVRDDYKDVVLLQTDPDLDTLRTQPAFQEVIAAVKLRP